MLRLLNKLWLALTLLAVSLLIGTVGFVLIEDYSVLDALYMTAITFSTVGFREVVPLSEDGKLFTSIYIIFNLGVFAYVISVFSTSLFEGELRKALKNFLIGREVKKMKNHVIICGFGRNGIKAAEVLFAEKKKFVVVENDLEAINMQSDFEKYQFLQGDATQDEVLLEAGLIKAETLITTLPKDADNVFITLTARQLNSDLMIITRASEVMSEKKLLRAGADHVVMPDNLGGAHMAQLIIKPYVIEFLEMLNGIGEKDMQLDEVSYENLKEEFQGKSIGELDVRKNTGVSIIAIKDFDNYKFNPESDRILTSGNIAILLGNESGIDQFKRDYCN